MKTQTLAKRVERMPSLFEDFFNPWNDWFNGGSPARAMNIPAVNITERKDDYLVSMAAPGLKKDDFEIKLEGNLLTIKSEKEERADQNGEKFTRREYSYSSFERCFTLPDEVNTDKIDAKYQDGELNVVLHKNEEAKKMSISKQIEFK
ncbi:MAG: Hsp20/alpha crystallin family protein [Ginsengibacter sp.]